MPGWLAAVRGIRMVVPVQGWAMVTVASLRPKPSWVPSGENILSQPGLGAVLGARVLAESGDDHDRYASAKARKNYAATSPITRASGKKKTVAARLVHNDRLVDALMTQAFTSLSNSPGARAHSNR